MTMQPKNDSKQDRPPRRVLVVDDDIEAGSALAKVLELKGFDVVIHRDGTSALEHLRAGSQPNFILTDLILPDLDGREVARQARLLAPEARIGLITGWSLEEEPDPSIVDAVFLKPIEIRVVISTFLDP